MRGPSCPRRVDGVACRAAERQANAKHHASDEQRLQPVAEDDGQIDVTRRSERLCVRANGKHREYERRGGNGLRQKVRGRLPDGRPRAEHGELHVRILRDRPVEEIHQPHQHRPNDGASHLCHHVTGHVSPLKGANRRQCQRYGWIQMCAAQASDGVHGDHHRERPIQTRSQSIHCPRPSIPRAARSPPRRRQTGSEWQSRSPQRCKRRSWMAMTRRPLVRRGDGAYHHP